MNNFWEICPKCHGEGFVMSLFQTTNTGFFKICDVCSGEKIISTITGWPPTGKPKQEIKNIENNINKNKE